MIPVDRGGVVAGEHGVDEQASHGVARARDGVEDGLRRSVEGVMVMVMSRVVIAER